MGVPQLLLPAGEQPDASLPLHVLPLYSLLAPEKQAQVRLWGSVAGCPLRLQAPGGQPARPAAARPVPQTPGSGQARAHPESAAGKRWPAAATLACVSQLPSAWPGAALVLPGASTPRFS